MLEFDQEEFKAVTEPTCLLQDVTGQKSARQLFLVHQHLSGAQPKGHYAAFYVDKSLATFSQRTAYNIWL